MISWTITKLWLRENLGNGALGIVCADALDIDEFTVSNAFGIDEVCLQLGTR